MRCLPQNYPNLKSYFQLDLKWVTKSLLFLELSYFAGKNKIHLSCLNANNENVVSSYVNKIRQLLRRGCMMVYSRTNIL